MGMQKVKYSAEKILTEFITHENDYQQASRLIKGVERKHDSFGDILNGTLRSNYFVGIRGAFLRNASSYSLFFLPTLCPYGTRSFYFLDVQLKSRVNKIF